MKDKILYLILGVLIGAVITGGCFLIFGKKNNQDFEEGRFRERPNFENMTDEEREEMMEKFKNEIPNDKHMGKPDDMLDDEHMDKPDFEPDDIPNNNQDFEPDDNYKSSTENKNM